MAEKWDDGMRMEDHWQEIKRVVARAQASSIHCAIASVAPDGMPHITPLGTVFLRDDMTGYYFDQYANGLAQNIASGSRICLMAVDTAKGFWFKSLLRGRFISPPGIRLYGTVGELRAATEQELASVRRRVGAARWLKGGRLIWSDFSQVRDIRFTSFKPVTYPTMMDGLWQSSAA